ncbi:MAG: hypothetical protein A2X05_05590 [Bacteroidetes bacterium GWE2_41_25]|nr:MAG: hypothetical protein A2X05_05590 [Bacteroidetes bacterium GWE2_41_25]
MSEPKNRINGENLNPKKILCVGEVLWDMLPTGPKAGGAPMNVALHLKKFGFNSYFAGRIGNDKLGADLRDFLERQGLDTNLLQVDPLLPTSTVMVCLGANNEVKFEIVDQVAWDRLEPVAELKEAALEASAIIYGTLASRHPYTRETILSLLNSKAVKLIDVNLRPPFNSRDVAEQLLIKADIAKLNDDELRFIAGWYNIKHEEKELVAWFAEKYGCGMVCVTRGANGALIYDHGSLFEHEGYKVKVVDTVGSGDAFLAGLLSKYLAGETIGNSLDFACAAGAFVATREGATPGYKIEDFNELIKER